MREPRETTRSRRPVKTRWHLGYTAGSFELPSPRALRRPSARSRVVAPASLAAPTWALFPKPSHLPDGVEPDELVVGRRASAHGHASERHESRRGKNASVLGQRRSQKFGEAKLLEHPRGRSSLGAPFAVQERLPKLQLRAVSEPRAEDDAVLDGVHEEDRTGAVELRGAARAERNDKVTAVGKTSHGRVTLNPDRKDVARMHR